MASAYIPTRSTGASEATPLTCLTKSRVHVCPDGRGTRRSVENAPGMSASVGCQIVQSLAGSDLWHLGRGLLPAMCWFLGEGYVGP